MSRLNLITLSGVCRMKNGFLFLILFLFSFSPVYSQKNELAVKETSSQQIKNIIAYGEIDSPPFQYVDDNGNTVGFCIDLFDALMKELGYKYNLNLAPIETMFMQMDNDSADVIIGMVNNIDRYSYCVPSLVLYHDIVCRSDFEFYSIGEIKNKEIILNTDIKLTPLYSQLSQDNEIIVVNSAEDGFKLLSQGMHDMMICNNYYGQFIINKYDYKNLQLRHLNKLPYNFGIAVSKDNPQLRDDINRAFRAVYARGEFDTLYIKWFQTKNYPQEANVPYVFIALAVVLFCFLLVATIALLRKIKKARLTISKQNEQLELAIRAGDISVWGFDVKSNIVYNIVGEVVAKGGVSIEEADKTIHPDDWPILADALERIIKGEPIPAGIVVRSISYGDEWHYVKKEFASVKNSKGEVITIIGTHKDINNEVLEQNKVDTLLKKYQTVFYNSPVGLEVYDQDGIVVDYNKAEAELLGISDIPKEEIIGKKLCFYDNPCYKDAIPLIKEKKSFNGIVEYNFDYPSLRGINIDSSKTGIHHIQLKITPIYNANGELRNIVCASIDITETVDLNKTMEHINNEKEFVIAMLPLGLLICDNDGTNIFLNNANEKIFEIKDVDHYLNSKVNIFNSNLLSSEVVESIKNNDEGELLAVINFDEIKEQNIYDTDGKGLKYLKINHRRIRNEIMGIDYYMLMVRDVTDNHKYHTEIENGKRKMELAVQSSNLLQWDYDCIADEMPIKGADADSFNFDYHELLQRIHEDDLEKAKDKLQMMKLGINRTFNIDVRIRAFDSDKLLFFSINGAPLEYDKNGKAISYTGFMRNNTDWFNLNDRLVKQNDMNKMILENINSGLVCLDRDHTVIWENVTDKFSSSMPCSNLMFVTGRKCEDTHGVHKPKCTTCLLDTMTNMKKSNISEKTLPDGTVVEIIASPIIGDDGILKGTILRVDDITDRKQLYNELEQAKHNAESSRELLSEILDRTPCSIFIKDVNNDFKFILANKFFCNEAKCREEDVLGKSDYELYNKAIANMYHEMDMQAVESGVPYNSIHEGTKGETYWSTTRSIIETHDGRKLLIGLGLDLTEIYNANRELKKAKDKAEQSDRLKSAFLANMSHEIRTPLNAIVGFSELLCEADEEDRIAYNKIIATNNDLLLRLINDILDLSKIDAGAVVLSEEVFDFSQFFDEIGVMMQQRMTNPNVEFIVDNPYEKCIVRLDRTRISQVILNYVTNAIKYTPRGYIKMSYKYVNKGIKISVEDSGIGVEDEKKDRVFGRFEKLDEFAQGTGLGLSICKAIMELHGGTVGFDSVVGKGSTFWAWKPNVDEPLLKSLPSNHKSNFNLSVSHNSDTAYSKIHKWKTLIVEDDDSNFVLLKSILKDQCDITRAVNGFEAVEMMRSINVTFDIILMDINMPVMNGLDATSEIRKFDSTTPIIAVTAYAYEADKQRAMQAGCNGFVSKPVKNDVIKAEIEKNIGESL